MITCQSALCTYVLMCQRAFRAHVLKYQRVLRAYVVMCQRANLSCVLISQRALHACVLLCLSALHTYLLTCQRTLRAYVLTCQRVLCAYVLSCQHFLYAYVPTCFCVLTCSCDITSNNKNKFLITCFRYIFGTFSLSFSCKIKLYMKSARQTWMSLETFFWRIQLYIPIYLLLGTIKWLDFGLSKTLRVIVS